jgi:hypothetical protein
MTTITEKWVADLTTEALVILRAIVPSLPWLLGASRFRLQDHWTLHHDAAVFTALRKMLKADDCADRGDTIGHLYRLSVRTCGAIQSGVFASARAAAGRSLR